jgi:hypothetical protein
VVLQGAGGVTTRVDDGALEEQEALLQDGIGDASSDGRRSDERCEVLLLGECSAAARKAVTVLQGTSSPVAVAAQWSSRGRVRPLRACAKLRAGKCGNIFFAIELRACMEMREFFAGQSGH